MIIKDLRVLKVNLFANTYKVHLQGSLYGGLTVAKNSDTKFI